MRLFPLASKGFTHLVAPNFLPAVVLAPGVLEHDIAGVTKSSPDRFCVLAWNVTDVFPFLLQFPNTLRGVSDVVRVEERLGLGTESFLAMKVIATQAKRGLNGPPVTRLHRNQNVGIMRGRRVP